MRPLRRARGFGWRGTRAGLRAALRQLDRFQRRLAGEDGTAVPADLQAALLDAGGTIGSDLRALSAAR